MMLIPTRVGPSQIHGQGLFTVEPVVAGTPVWRHEAGFDRTYSPEAFSALSPLLQQHLRWFAYRDARDHYVLSGDHTCFMNHSDSPNTGAPAGVVEVVHTVALRDLAAGEELTCDYFAFDQDAAKKLGHPDSTQG